MDISHDFIRREAKDIDVEHHQALGRDRAVLDHLVNGDGARLGDDRKADLVLKGLNRRKFLMLGSAGVLSSAVFAACKGATGSKVAVPPPATTTTTAAGSGANDITILRTAASIEALAVMVYDKAIKGGLVKTAAVVTLAKLFQSQHVQHGDLFNRAVNSAGGTPYTDPNPVLLTQLAQPRLDALKTEMDVVNLAYDLEHLAAATYQNDIGLFANLKYNVTVASVGGTEARHVALLAVISGKSATGTPDNAFQVDTEAVKPGSGI
ncbi:MAG: ferritin-like domain-containing protein [Actinomycetota bacterium]|nr:ferritin-like domain-containing protein [Actinomycetota bacterium]